VQLVAAVADRVACHADVDLPVADANVGDLEGRPGWRGLSESGSDGENDGCTDEESS